MFQWKIKQDQALGLALSAQLQGTLRPKLSKNSATKASPGVCADGPPPIIHLLMGFSKEQEQVFSEAHRATPRPRLGL